MSHLIIRGGPRRYQVTLDGHELLATHIQLDLDAKDIGRAVISVPLVNGLDLDADGIEVVWAPTATELDQPAVAQPVSR